MNESVTKKDLIEVVAASQERILGAASKGFTATEEKIDSKIDGVEERLVMKIDGIRSSLHRR